MSTRGELCSDTAAIRSLGTMPDAEKSHSNPYAAAPCSSVTRITRKDLAKYDPRDAGGPSSQFFAYLRTRSDVRNDFRSHDEKKLVAVSPMRMALSMAGILVTERMMVFLMLDMFVGFIRSVTMAG